MTTEEEKYQLIDQFLEGNLPENHDFYNLLDNDLLEEVNIQRLLKDALLDHQLLKVKSDLNVFHKEKVSFKSKMNWIVVSIAGIIAVGTLLYFLSTKISNEDSKEKRIIDQQIIEKSASDSSFSTDKNKTAAPGANNESLLKDKEIDKIKKSTILVESKVQQNLEKSSDVKPDSISLSKLEQTTEVKQQEKPINPSKDSEIKPITADPQEKVPSSKPHVKQKHEIKNYVFEPQNETWEVPNDLEKAGKLSIFDRSGKMMYRREFNKTEKLVWEGNSSEGGILPPSVYVFMIEYTDGSTSQGTITLSY